MVQVLTRRSRIFSSGMFLELRVGVFSAQYSRGMPEVQPRSDVITLTVNEKCLVATGCIMYIRPATSATLKVPFV